MLNVLIVEDHALVREGLLQTILRLGADVRAIGAGDCEQALVHLDANPNFDIVLLDLMLPGMQGTAFLSILRRRFPTVPVVVLTALEDAETVRQVMALGASGYVPKASDSEMMLEALRQVLNGEVFLPTKFQGLLLEADNRKRSTQGITPAQQRVWELLSAGKSNRDISVLLGISEGTTKVHVSAILKALGVENRAQAALAFSAVRPKKR